MDRRRQEGGQRGSTIEPSTARRGEQIPPILLHHTYPNDRLAQPTATRHDHLFSHTALGYHTSPPNLHRSENIRTSLALVGPG